MTFGKTKYTGIIQSVTGIESFAKRVEITFNELFTHY